MTFLCDNDICTHHVPIPGRDENSLRAVVIDADGERRTFERHLYVQNMGVAKVYLCDYCHAAVQLVMGPRPG